MTEITIEKPRLATGSRLAFDKVRDRHILLYPEGALTLNETAVTVLELCDGVDLLIHDAQHTNEEYEAKRHWGHCTIEYALHVGHEAGVRSLALFHHDPLHTDEQLDRLGAQARERWIAAGGEEGAIELGVEGRELEPRALAPGPATAI